jgi:uncharacterized protein YyaL (SSP411 family)
MANRLINENSPYLLEHADNPVLWYPWGDEAFERAKEENKPAFLSIGYSACHWCHVMARECFEDQEVAEALNRDFISVKVDREERPDVDSVYMNACQLMTGSGGWPLTVFLSPDKKPFYSGTYFPKKGGYGRPGFLELIAAIKREWDNNHTELLKHADTVIGFLNRETQGGNEIEATGATIHYLKNSYDNKYGGFGGAPKFPLPSSLLFLTEYAKAHGDSEALNMLNNTLTAMYKGGLFDHIGYGFSRYSTDKMWLVPHFEKMLYDNAQLISVYSRAFTLTGDPLYSEIVNRTVYYLEREMKDPSGGFYSAEDADIEGEEGLYYVFTRDELLKLLGKERGEEFCDSYGITKAGNFEGKNIPNLLGKDIERNRSEYILKNNSIVYLYRKTRHDLKVDDKILSAWNGWTISALIEAYRATGDKKYLNLAIETRRAIGEKLTENGMVYNSWRSGKSSKRGYIDDYAAIINADIILYCITLNNAYLESALRFTMTALDEFFDPSGGFFLTMESGEKLVARPKEVYDGVTPSGNSAMYLNFLMLSSILDRGKEGERIREALDKQRNFLNQTGSPGGQSYYAYALMRERNLRKLVIVLEGGVRKSVEKDIKTLTREYDIVKIISPDMTYRLKDGKTTFYACRGERCLAPVNELEELNDI